ncbi:hypothetical protein K8I61_07170 [bacterium]|nr:hypothetical protein [bacterium]
MIPTRFAAALAFAAILLTALAPALLRADDAWIDFLVVARDCDEGAIHTLRDELSDAGEFPLLILPDAPAMVVRAREKALVEIASRGFGVYRGPVNAVDAASSAPDACRERRTAAYKRWNELSWQLLDDLDFSSIDPTTEGPPLAGDAFPNPVAALADMGPMTGSIGIVMLAVESDGTLDPNKEDWTQQTYDNVYNELVEGMAWWATHAAAHGQSVTFTVYHYGLGSPYYETKYEPISRSSFSECLWINDVMRNLGYSNPACATTVHAFNEFVTNQFGLTNALSVFVVNSVNDDDGAFSNDYSAYSYYGGPYWVMTYDNGGWGIDNFSGVASHEMGHSFWACDEYYAPGYFTCGCTCVSNPWHISNGNCEKGCDTSDPCLMDDLTLTTCPHSRAQIGWGFSTTTTTTPTTTTTAPPTTTTTTVTIPTTTTTAPTTTTTTIPGDDDAADDDATDDDAADDDASDDDATNDDASDDDTAPAPGGDDDAQSDAESDRGDDDDDGGGCGGGCGC